MPDSNNPLETALRNVREVVAIATEKDLGKNAMTHIRATLIDFYNREVTPIAAELSRLQALTAPVIAPVGPMVDVASRQTKTGVQLVLLKHQSPSPPQEATLTAEPLAPTIED